MQNIFELLQSHSSNLFLFIHFGWHLKMCLTVDFDNWIFITCVLIVIHWLDLLLRFTIRNIWIQSLWTDMALPGSFIKVGIWYFTARKRGLGQGNVFTPLCLSVHGVEGSPWQGPPSWTEIPPQHWTEIPLNRDTPSLPLQYRTGGTHPTGMHSCQWITTEF